MRSKNYTKKLIVFTSIGIALSGTAFAQSTIRDDSTVVYTIEQDVRCLKCLISAPKKDSLIERYKDLNSYKDTIIAGQINEIVTLNEELDTEVKEKTLWRSRSFRWSFISFFGGGLGFFIIFGNS